MHRRVAAAYTDWLIAANGIASHLAASCSGIRLLLLLLLLQSPLADEPPAFGPAALSHPLTFASPGQEDGRSRPLHSRGPLGERASVRSTPLISGHAPGFKRLRIARDSRGARCCYCCGPRAPTTLLRQAPCSCKNLQKSVLPTKLSLDWLHPLFLQHRDSSLPAPSPMFQARS